MQWLQEAMGEELADLRKDTVARLLGKEDNSPQVQRMLEIRQELGKTSTKKYDAIEAAVCPDGRVRGLLQFYGANRTGAGQAAWCRSRTCPAPTQSRCRWPVSWWSTASWMPSG